MKSVSLPALLLLSAAVLAILASLKVFQVTSVSCVVDIEPVKSSSGVSSNVFFSALDGAYLKLGQPLKYIPDMHEWPPELHNSELILFFQGKWALATTNTANQAIVRFVNNDFLASHFVDHPPNSVSASDSHWIAADNQKTELVKSVSCSGSLQNARRSKRFYESATDNLATLWNRPVTCFILIIFFLVFYLIHTEQLVKEKLVYSYDSLINYREYFRIFTSSLSHFSLIHIMFNAMGLYQLNILEYFLGSSLFLTYIVYLIPLTILTVAGVQYVMINYFRREDQIMSTAVGFSCVIFAEIVMVAVLQDEFCPIFLFPKFCFKSYHRVSGSYDFSFNLGPFVLLIITKLIIPQSSLMGHSAGVFMGFLISWGLFKDVSPMMFLSFMAILVIIREGIYFSFSTFSAVQSDSSSSDDDDEMQEREQSIFSSSKYKRMYKVWFLLSILSTWLFYFYFSWAQVFIRATASYLLAIFIVNLRHAIISSQVVAQNQANRLSSIMIFMTYYLYSPAVSIFIFFVVSAATIVLETYILFQLIQSMNAIATTSHITSPVQDFVSIESIKSWAAFMRLSGADIAADIQKTKDLFSSVVFWLLWPLRKVYTYIRDKCRFSTQHEDMDQDSENSGICSRISSLFSSNSTSRYTMVSSDTSEHSNGSV